MKFNHGGTESTGESGNKNKTLCPLCRSLP
jgi:hypothetical protein